MSIGIAAADAATADRVVSADGAPSIGRATVVLTGATLAASGVNYALNLLLARWMIPSEFGDTNLIVTLMLVLTAVAVTLQLVTAQRISTSATAARGLERRALLRQAWRIGLLVALAITVSSPLIAAMTSSASAVPFVLLAAGLPCYLAQAVERGVLQGRLRFGDLAATLVIEATTRLGVAVALVLAGLGVVGATAGITASFVASWWLARRRVLALSARSETEVGPAESRSLTARRATQATMLLLVGQIVINNGDVVLAKMLFDADAAGVYSVVALVGRAIFFLSWSVVTAAFPMAAKANAAERRALRRRAVRTVAAMSTLMTLAVALLAPPLTPIVFGDAYATAAGLFLPYAIATSLFAVANVMASLSAAQGDRRTPTVIIGGAVGQTVLLLAFADDPIRMVWLQVLAMGMLLVVTAWVSRPAGVVRSSAVVGCVDPMNCDLTATSARLSFVTDHRTTILLQAFDSAPTSLSLSDENGRIIGANRAFWELFGHDPAVELSVSDLSRATDQQWTASYLAQMVEGEHAEFQSGKRFVRGGRVRIRRTRDHPGHPRRRSVRRDDRHRRADRGSTEGR